jgi:hypothetical protein
MNISNSLFVHTGNVGLCVGLMISRSENESIRQVLERCTTFNPPSKYPVIEMRIPMPCGNEAYYETLDDIPNKDTPCPCGNPNHWYVKILIKKETEC